MLANEKSRSVCRGNRTAITAISIAAVRERERERERSGQLAWAVEELWRRGERGTYSIEMAISILAFNIGERGKERMEREIERGRERELVGSTT